MKSVFSCVNSVRSQNGWKDNFTKLFYCFKNLEISGIVPFVETPLKGRLVVFLKLLLIGYFRLGYIGLGNWPRRVRNRRKASVTKTKNRPLRSVATKGTIPEISLI